jgi:ArsR family transcriptional regulator, arsenate/arsenite/antimonite-responsive transcriptional repressor
MNGVTHPPSPPAALPREQVHRITRALADPRRFDILKAIAANNGAPCTALRADFPITAPTMSHHLKELEAAGLIAGEREGKFMNLTFLRHTWNAYLAELNKL